ncbi:secretion-regulating guanine nucleotide exchange factor [Teleopsis dalmanni]|uniref:secretion-regulating guanine nucleotide exchange factor n=1 Tax=Teleopsis dalmanni TaxID=139649 RepID=UPI0018CDA348|nr:secretion-regulating guanine nucleotide exchange factor [Teleopsis dalmanni]XP_037958519.1 secretion-regulating guanine nucleotide exchange factor [Teleopsis dalmanni]
MSVYVWGANSHGQLGLGFESELCMSPQLLTKHSFSASGVRCIRGGGGHVLVLDTYGRVHACGWNNRGQLGLDSLKECHNRFECIPSDAFQDVPVEYIACGWDISGCVTVTKELYVWGSNSYQQLGICQREYAVISKPMNVSLPRGEKSQRISFGMRHCVVLTQNYKIFVFGNLTLQQPPEELSVTTMMLNHAKVMKLALYNSKDLRITDIASGQNHLLLKIQEVNHKGDWSGRRVISLGNNKFGQANSFQFEDEIKQIIVGWTHNAVLLKNNCVYLWGRNCYGQLGTGGFTDKSVTPIALQLPGEVVPARLHFGAEHCLLRTTCGAVYTWGWNEHGNCGNNNTENIDAATLVELGSTCKVAGTGAGFCFAICEAT